MSFIVRISTTGRCSYIQTLFIASLLFSGAVPYNGHCGSVTGEVHPGIACNKSSSFAGRSPAAALPNISPSILITEIFPKATAAEPEWFEIHNGCSTTVDLKGWSYSTGGDAMTLIDEESLVAAGSYAVITEDARALKVRYPFCESGNIVEPRRWSRLKNEGDTIELLDSEGNVRETVCYDRKWFDSWGSLPLERNDGECGCCASSWSVAMKASILGENVAPKWRKDGVPTLEIAPLPFTPDNDGVDDRLEIRVTLPSTANVRIDIYGLDGRIIKRFFGMAQKSLFWDGLGDHGPAPVGPFFVVARVTDGKNVRYIRKKGVLWRR